MANKMGKKVLSTIMKVELGFDTMEELQTYKENNKHKENWKFVDEHKEDDSYVLIVEKSYEK